MTTVEVVQQLGFPIALVLVLLWDRKKMEDRNHAEQERLAKRLSSVEDYVRNELVVVLTRAIVAIEKHEKCDLKKETK